MVSTTRKQKEAEKLKIFENIAFVWDRQLGEPKNAFALFQKFLNMGHTRSLKKIAEISGLKHTTIIEYSSHHQWTDRAKKYDIAEEEEFKVKLNEEIFRSRIRQQRIGKEMQDLGKNALKLIKKNPENLSTTEIARFIEIGAKIENLALGNSTEITKSKVESKVNVKVEEIDPDIAKMIGKMIALKESAAANK